MEKRGILERTFVVSSRVDARDMAVFVKWLDMRGEMKYKHWTKSGIVAEAVRVLAATIAEQDPKMVTTTVEQAYIELSQLGLLSRNSFALSAIARGMKMESLAQEPQIDFCAMQKIARGMYAGQGLSGQQLQAATSQEVNSIVQAQARTQDPTDKEVLLEGIKWEVEDRLSHGDPPEEVERDRQANMKKYGLVDVDLAEVKTEAQQETIKKGAEFLVQQRQQTTPTDQVEQNKLEGASEIYRLQVLTKKWTEQEFVEKTLPKLWPNETIEVWQEKLQTVVEIAQAKGLKKPKVIDSDLSPAEREARDRTELAEQRAAMGGFR